MPSVQTPPEPIAPGTTDLLEREPPAFGPLPIYSQSSQARHWSFSPAQLAEMRAAVNTEAQESIKQLARDTNGSDENSPLLSVDDELAIIRFYLLRIGPITKRLGLPPLVEATAISLMKRFYLRNSCMFFHPKTVMYVDTNKVH